MGTDTDSTPANPNAEFVRRSAEHPGYVLVQFSGSDRLAIVIASPVDPDDDECYLVDGHVHMPIDDPRHGGKTCEIFVVKDDTGVDLAADFENHTGGLVEESRALAAALRVEGVRR